MKQLFFINREPTRLSKYILLTSLTSMAFIISAPRLAIAQLQNVPAPAGSVVQGGKTVVPAALGNGTQSTGFAAEFKKQCATGFGAVYCAMAAISVASAIQGFMGASGANKTVNKASSCSSTSDFIDCGSTPSTQPGGGGPGSGSPDSAGIGGPGTPIPSDLQPPPGYSYNPKTGMVHTPTGNYPVSDFANGQSMADAGLIPKSKIAAVNKVLKGLQDKYKVDAMGIKGGGGGGAGGGGGTVVQYYDPNAGAHPFAPKAQTQGLALQLSDGEMIGAQTDDIFAMIHRKYLSLTKAGEFVSK